MDSARYLFLIFWKTSRHHCYFFYSGSYNSTERTRTSQLGHGVRTRHLQLCNRQCLYFNADADAITNAEMPMPRFPNGFLSIYQGPPTLPNF